MKRFHIALASSAAAASASRWIFALAMLGLLTGPPAQADYVSPLGWEGNPYFTHQTWEFGTGNSPVDADIDLNPFGVPKLGVHGENVGWSAHALGKEGVWTIEQGWAQVEGIFPNEENEHLSKEVWIRVLLHTSIRGGVPIDVLFEFPPGTYVVAPKESSVVPEADGWLYQTYLFELTPQPDWEVVGLNFSLPAGAYVAIDQLDIDTRCVPEPATLLLLGLGGLALLHRRRQP